MPHARSLALVFTPLALATGVPAQESLITTFAGGGTASGFMFDLSTSRPGGSRLVALQLTLSAPALTTVTARLWYHLGTYVGTSTNPGAWMQLFFPLQGISAGPGSPTTLNLPPYGLIVLPGTTQAVFVALDTPAGTVANFTPIPPASAFYASPHVRLDGGIAKGPLGLSGPDISDAMVNTRLDFIDACEVYANCDRSWMPPVLNVNDFVCFNESFAAGSTTANCDQSTTIPILNVLDFICFLNAFARGCTTP
ncbi:MAG: hypothetical protein JNM80_01535 [Phycisphaerae bacterium]|nr:hypothetical protein [Phycisphaerae bacterium]